MRIARVILAIAAMSVLATGCARQKEDATKALAAVETSVLSVKEDATKYAPEVYQSVESSLNSLKESLAKEDYKAVIAGTPAVQSSVESLKSAIASGKEKFQAAEAEWSALSADIPKMVEAIQSRVDILGSAKKLPKNLSQEAVDGAKSGLEWMKAQWHDAISAFGSGNAPEAVEKAHGVQAKGQEVLAALGMNAA
jgi:hypothetical protein